MAASFKCKLGLLAQPSEWPADLSPDGRFTWNGTAWKPNQVSPDGYYYLYRDAWHRLPSPPIAAVTAPAAAVVGPDVPRPRTRLAALGLGLALLAGVFVIAKASNVFNTSGGRCVLAIDDPTSQTAACRSLALREFGLLGAILLLWFAAAMCALLALVRLARLKAPSWPRRWALGTFGLVVVQVIGLTVAGNLEDTRPESEYTGNAELTGALNIHGAAETLLINGQCAQGLRAINDVGWDFSHSVDHRPFLIEMHRAPAVGGGTPPDVVVTVKLLKDYGATSPVLQVWNTAPNSRVQDMRHADGTGTVTFRDLAPALPIGPVATSLSGRVEAGCNTHLVSKY